jgi:hypothetical protein
LRIFLGYWESQERWQFFSFKRFNQEGCRYLFTELSFRGDKHDKWKEKKEENVKEEIKRKQHKRENGK